MSQFTEMRRKKKSHHTQYIAKSQRKCRKNLECITNKFRENKVGNHENTFILL